MRRSQYCDRNDTLRVDVTPFSECRCNIHIILYRGSRFMNIVHLRERIALTVFVENTDPTVTVCGPLGVAKYMSRKRVHNSPTRNNRTGWRADESVVIRVVNIQE